MTAPLGTAPVSAPVGEPAPAPVPDRAVRARLTLIWALLIFNGMAWIAVPTVVAIPQRVGQLMTFAALVLAFLLALDLNGRLLVRPNAVLVLYTLVALAALVASARGMAGAGALFRSARFGLFIGTVWLTTPWWGRADLLLVRAHLTAVGLAAALAVPPILIAPSLAFSTYGRLTGALWPTPPPQVAHYAAVGAGLAVVLWLGGRGRRWHVAIAVGGAALVLLTQTRTATIALVAGLLCAGLSLFLARRRVRKAATLVLILAPLAVMAVVPSLATWYLRDQSPEQIADLTGRKQVWEALVAEPRTGMERAVGRGLSDKSFGGRPIDSSWLAIYQDQGLVGVALVAGVLVVLLVTAASRPAGPGRAVAVFLVVYCAVASYTEVGLGDASPYILHLMVAASVLLPARAPATVAPEVWSR